MCSAGQVAGGAVCTAMLIRVFFTQPGPIASFRCAAELGRYGGI